MDLLFSAIIAPIVVGCVVGCTIAFFKHMLEARRNNNK